MYQITLVIPNFQPNCENWAWVLLRVFGFDQFLGFNFNFLLFPPMTLHFQFISACTEPYAVGITSWALVQIISKPLRLDNKMYLVQKRPSLYLDLSLPVGNGGDEKKKCILNQTTWR